MKLEREQSFGNSLARRTSQALADNVVGLTIDTGTRSSDGSAVPEGGLAPSLHQELNGDRSEAEALAAENEDEEEESDWGELLESASLLARILLCFRAGGGWRSGGVHTQHGRADVNQHPCGGRETRRDSE